MDRPKMAWYCHYCGKKNFQSFSSDE